MDKNYYEIRRETSKYNKYMKWHLLFFREDKTEYGSEYCKTREMAESKVNRMKEIGKQGFPMGNKLYFTEYTELQNEGREGK